MSVQGGSPVVLCDASNPRGASWVQDDTIVAALVNTSGLWRVAADGGAPQPLTTRKEGELTHRWPQVLPGNTGVLFTAHSGSLNSYEDASIDVLIPESGERRTIWRGGYFGRFIPVEGTRGYLVYLQRGVTSAAGRFDYSSTGTLAYRSGATQRAWPIVWVDNTGKIDRLLDGPVRYYSPRFSPDGRRSPSVSTPGRGPTFSSRISSATPSPQLPFQERPMRIPCGPRLEHTSRFDRSSQRSGTCSGLAPMAPAVCNRC